MKRLAEPNAVSEAHLYPILRAFPINIPPRICWLVAPGMLLGACAALPTADDDIARALANAGPMDRIQLLRSQGERIAQTPFTTGNSLQLLRDGPATYAAMENLIVQARSRLDVESYIFDEVEGTRLANLLVERCAHGVAVNLIYDAWGSADTPTKLFDQLRAGGVRVVQFNPIDPFALVDFSANKRDHRKLMIADGRVAITGGLNVSEVYENRKQRAGHEDAATLPWRDTDVRVEGPAVAELEKLFAQTWREQDGGPLPAPAASTSAPGDYSVQVIGDVPDQRRQFLYRSLLVAISLARSSVHLTSGYFVPTPDLARALREAARRGVDVAVLTPSVTDPAWTVAASRAYYTDLLEAGVHIYELQGAVLHAKTAVIDGIWSTVGSSNLDWRSVVLNNEVNIVVLGSGFGQQMEAMFQADIARGRRIDRAAWRQRPFWERCREQLARAFAPFL